MQGPLISTFPTETCSSETQIWSAPKPGVTTHHVASGETEATVRLMGDVWEACLSLLSLNKAQWMDGVGRALGSFRVWIPQPFL